MVDNQVLEKLEEWRHGRMEPSFPLQCTFAQVIWDLLHKKEESKTINTITDLRIQTQYKVIPTPLQLTEDWLNDWAKKGWMFGCLLPDGNVMFNRIIKGDWNLKQDG